MVQKAKNNPILETIKKMWNENAPIIWRFIRGSFSAAVGSVFTQTYLLGLDWTKPKQAVQTVLVALVSGFLLALSKAIRDKYGTQYNLVNKLLI